MVRAMSEGTKETEKKIINQKLIIQCDICIVMISDAKGKKKKKKTGTQFSSTASDPVPKDLTHKYLKCAWHAYETVN